MSVLPRSKPRLIEAILREVVPETAAASTLVFELLGEVPSYRAGQFVTIDPHQFEVLAAEVAFREALVGRRELPRAYSISSAPGERFAITVKEEPHLPSRHPHAPLLSPLLVHGLRPGTPMQVTGFTGPYNLPPDIEQRTDHLVHVVAGSGAVPNWSILKFALRAHPGLRHTFIYSNTVWEDVIFRDALTVLAASNPERLRVVHTLTRESPGTVLPVAARRGRVSGELLAELVPDSRTAFAYVCGPAIKPWDRRAALEAGATATPRFLESVVGFLHQLGFTRDRIRHEAFG